MPTGPPGSAMSPDVKPMLHVPGLMIPEQLGLVGGLDEEDRALRHAPILLQNMVAVVQPDAQDRAGPREGCQQPDSRGVVSAVGVSQHRVVDRVEQSPRTVSSPSSPALSRAIMSPGIAS